MRSSAAGNATNENTAAHNVFGLLNTNCAGYPAHTEVEGFPIKAGLNKKKKTIQRKVKIELIIIYLTPFVFLFLGSFGITACRTTQNDLILCC